MAHCTGNKLPVQTGLRFIFQTLLLMRALFEGKRSCWNFILNITLTELSGQFSRPLIAAGHTGAGDRDAEH